MFQCLPGLYSALFDKVQEKEEAKCHPLTRFALMALARKNLHRKLMARSKGGHASAMTEMPFKVSLSSSVSSGLLGLCHSVKIDGQRACLACLSALIFRISYQVAQEVGGRKSPS